MGDKKKIWYSTTQALDYLFNVATIEGALVSGIHGLKACSAFDFLKSSGIKLRLKRHNVHK